MAAKDKDQALRRLGGGRWQTRDGRFTIEPQGGSWVVVDAEQTDDLGLQLVRGPFGSLGAAREAIDEARTDAAPVSPLAARLEEAAERPRPVRERPTRPTRGPAPKTPAAPAPKTRAAPSPERPTLAPEPPPSPEPPPPPPPPPEPAWIRRLRPAERTAARALVARLEAAGLEDAEGLARAELVDGVPAVARAALRRAIEAVTAEKGDREDLVERLVERLTHGRDEALDVEWRLTDGDGRQIEDPLGGR